MPWNSIPCNFSNSFCTWLDINVKPKPLFFSFFPVGKSTQEFPCKYVAPLKPRSSTRSCSLTSLSRFPIMVMVLFWHWVFTTWCCDWLSYSDSLVFWRWYFYLVGLHLSVENHQMISCSLFVVVACLKVDFPKQKFEFLAKS